MNGRNRHRQYRKSIYRRRSIGTVIVTAAISLAVFLIALLIVGNILHKKSIERFDAGADNTANVTSTDDNNTATVKRETPSINGRLCLLRTSDSSVFGGRLDRLLTAGCTQVSIPLNQSSDEALLYNSKIASSLDLNIASNPSLSDAVFQAKERGMRTSGIFYTDALASDNILIRSAELSRTAAIISEILNFGVDDVIIVAPQMKAEHIDELIEFVSDVHSLTESGSVGFALTEDILTNENASSLINKLNSGCDFLAVDLSEHGDSSPSEYIDSKINSQYLIYLHMYKMRLLLPYSSNEEVQGEIIKAATDNGINNYQTIQ